MDDVLKERFSLFFRDFIDSRGWKDKDFGEACGFDKSLTSRVLSGNTSFEKIKIACSKLNLDYLELVNKFKLENTLDQKIPGAYNNAVDRGGVKHPGFTTRPLMGRLQVSFPFRTEDVVGAVNMLQELVTETSYCLSIHDDRNFPTLRPGWTVQIQYFKEPDPFMLNGKMCGVVIEGQDTIGNIIVWDDVPYVEFSNRKYAKVEIGPDCKIVGQVVRIVDGPL